MSRCQRLPTVAVVRHRVQNYGVQSRADGRERLLSSCAVDEASVDWLQPVSDELSWIRCQKLTSTLVSDTKRALRLLERFRPSRLFDSSKQGRRVEAATP
jgi:hypothetical protein